MLHLSYCMEQLIPNALYNIQNISFITEITEEIYNNNIIWLDERPKPLFYDIKVEWFNYLKEQKDDEICKIRDEKIADGIPYTFPDGITGHVQTRDVVDHRNIQANGSAAQILIMTGQTDTLMYFRDVENVVHELYPQQMLNMTMFCMSYGQNIYTNSWIHKDTIKSIEIIDNDVDTAINNIINYDVYSNWTHIQQYIPE